MIRLLANIYGCFVERRNHKFDTGKIPVFTPEVPVISIGNISAGGTGKTPLTLLVAKFLLDNGYKPCIISSGYHGKFSGTLLVSNGSKITCEQHEAGDEMYMLAKNISVPIVINKHKFLAAKNAEALCSPDCIIVDDGFQHRRLHRDLNIVIIDDKTLAHPYPIPQGRLREKISGIVRADIVCYTVATSEIEQFLSQYRKQFVTVQIKTKTDGFYTLNDTLFVNKITEAAIFSGIAHHSKFRNSVRECGIKIADEIIFGDHHDYSLQDIRRLIDFAKANNTKILITTEKDAVKLAKYSVEFAKANVETVYLKIASFVSYNSKQFYNSILSLMKDYKNAGKSGTI